MRILNKYSHLTQQPAYPSTLLKNLHTSLFGTHSEHSSLRSFDALESKLEVWGQLMLIANEFDMFDRFEREDPLFCAYIVHKANAPLRESFHTANGPF